MTEDHTAEVESMFRAFAARHSLAIEKVDQTDIELLMYAPKQRDLSFELTLGHQNTDEINIGFEGFWSYIFPFPEVRDHVEETLDAIVSGDCRLAVHRQFGVIVLRALERRYGDKWKTIYRASDLRIPLLPRQVLYIFNTPSNSATAQI